MEIIIVVFILLLILIALILFFNVIFIVFEHNYGLLFNKPFFVHLYFKRKKLSASQIHVLHHNFTFYNALTTNNKRNFEHRVASFIEAYEFHGKDNFLITEEVKLLVASTAVMLTFGMRTYLFDVIDKIIIYPSEYYSTTNEAYHKGEFNPRMKAVVLSWEDFNKGFEITNDNLNLGIHEFTHVLNFHGLKNEDASAIVFARMFEQINKAVLLPQNKERLIQSNYFRVYAYTNQFEFLAVIIEHFFETPTKFKEEFPELFNDVCIMLNYRNFLKIS